MKKVYFLLLISIVAGYSQMLNRAGTFVISVNPLKLVYGLINVGFEYYPHPGQPIQFSSEYLITDYILKRERHPDLVYRAGGRYHFFNKESFGYKNDLQGGLFIGCSYSGLYDTKNTLNFGIDCGYKYQMNNSFILSAEQFMFLIIIRKIVEDLQ